MSPVLKIPSGWMRVVSGTADIRDSYLDAVLFDNTGAVRWVPINSDEGFISVKLPWHWFRLLIRHDYLFPGGTK